jgi:hypothetical protein
MERTSRMDPHTQPGWGQLDKEQAEAAWNAMSRATSEGDELGARQGARQTRWDEDWARAEGGLKPRLWNKQMGQLKGTLDEMSRSPEAVGNARVMSALKEVDDAVTMMGGEFTPAHLQQLRAQLNGKPSLDAKATSLQSAPRENPAIRELIDHLDDVLDVSTGGRWAKVREGYTEESGKVHAAKAAKIVRGTFMDEATGRMQTVSRHADVPEVTFAGVNRAMNAARKPDKSLALSPDAESKLRAVQEALRKQNITEAPARTATAGRGPYTAGDLAGQAGAQAAGAAGIPSIAVQAAAGAGSRLKNIGQRNYNEQLANALRDPSEMLKLLETKLQSGQPLTRAEEAALRSLRGAVGVGGAELATQ